MKPSRPSAKVLKKTRRKFLQPTPSTLRLPVKREQGKASLTALALMKRKWTESSAVLNQSSHRQIQSAKKPQAGKHQTDSSSGRQGFLLALWSSSMKAARMLQWMPLPLHTKAPTQFFSAVHHLHLTQTRQL